MIPDATIFFSGNLHNWPPQSDSQIVSHELPGCTISVWVHPQGSWSLTALSDGELHRFQFARVVFDGPTSFMVVTYGFASGEPLLIINGQSIPVRAKPAMSRSTIVKTASAPVGEIGLVSPYVPHAANEPEGLFIRKLHELQQRIAVRDNYTVLQASGLLRHILDDLWSKANGRVRQKAVFTTINFRDALPLTPDFHWRFLAPLDSKAAGVLELNKDQFLSAPVLSLPAITASVRDVVGARANVKGGVHFGSPKGARAANETALLEMDKSFGLLHTELSLRALQGIAEVTIRALLPTAEAIQDEAFQAAMPP